MMKFLRWVLISMLCSSCTLQPQMIATEQKTAQDEIIIESASELEKAQDEIIIEIVNEPVEIEKDYIEIEGVLKESFVQGQDNQWYVYHDINGNKTTAGPNFMDYRCTLDSDNLILYGHSSRTSQILFTPLMQYLDEGFAREHHEILLHFKDETRVYQLFSVFLFSVKQASDNDWMQTDFQKEYLFQQALSRLRKRSLYAFEESSADQLLTLVTCNTQNHDERLIVMASRNRQ